MIGIYKITNTLNGKSYIGQSINLEHRLQEHKKCEGKSYIHNAIKKYGLNNFSFEIIEECQVSQLDEREIYWINFYDSYYEKNGYNMTFGGDTKHSFSKRVLQYSLQGDFIQEFSSITEASKYCNISSGKISRVCNGLSKTAGGYQWKFSDDIDREIFPQNPKGRAVDKYDSNHIFIKTYGSCAAAGEDNNIPSTHISRACKKKIKAGGFYWQYHD